MGSPAEGHGHSLTDIYLSLFREPGHRRRQGRGGLLHRLGRDAGRDHPLGSGLRQPGPPADRRPGGAEGPEREPPARLRPERLLLVVHGRAAPLLAGARGGLAVGRSAGDAEAQPAEAAHALRARHDRLGSGGRVRGERGGGARPRLGPRRPGPRPRHRRCPLGRGRQHRHRAGADRGRRLPGGRGQVAPARRAGRARAGAGRPGDRDQRAGHAGGLADHHRPAGAGRGPAGDEGRVRPRRLGQGIPEAINRFETTLRARRPDAKWIFVEPDIRPRPAGAAAGG